MKRRQKISTLISISEYRIVSTLQYRVLNCIELCVLFKKVTKYGNVTFSGELGLQFKQFAELSDNFWTYLPLPLLTILNSIAKKFNSFFVFSPKFHWKMNIYTGKMNIYAPKICGGRNAGKSAAEHQGKNGRRPDLAATYSISLYM